MSLATPGNVKRLASLVLYFLPSEDVHADHPLPFPVWAVASRYSTNLFFEASLILFSAMEK
jgi:hypothetical protein